MAEKPTVQIEKWSLTGNGGRGSQIVGNVIDHPNHFSGEQITTTPIVNFKIDTKPYHTLNGGDVIETEDYNYLLIGERV